MKQLFKIDFLKKSSAKLEQLQAQSANAIDLVAQTIQKIDGANQEIEKTIEDIVSYEVELQFLRGNLKQTKLNNDKISKNFKALLCVD